ncbi:Plasmid stabilization system [Magnetospirillum sp. XM-1]|uniref:type II toxin-antitoxin system RelE/ParE family toxin n=1 Tax=Magnetospirillum sp. XM-1 TaxID=1663591 RepID=UPI00073DFB47|nr:type II toxin-antitoxin system RelE/ParE family toxin [Magnetospirillum sp. XM-1]CUW38203.1 Plasmid stabilization system [Magnetospirillum sp. XM-1]
MRRLVLLDYARDDMLGILDHVAQASGSVATAMDFVGRLRQRCRDLAGLPGTLGRSRPELRPDLRSIAFRGYVIFFRYVDDRVEVVSILEGHRDIDAHFDDMP